MDDSESLFAALFGGLIGAAIASPSEKDKTDLQEFKALKQQISARKLKMGDIPHIEKLLERNEYYQSFTEIIKMYLYGFFKGAVVLSGSLIETILKEKYGDQKFNNLIEKTKKDGIITQTDYFLLHSLRSERNDHAHDILNQINEDNCVLVIRIMIKLLDRFKWVK